MTDKKDEVLTVAELDPATQEAIDAALPLDDEAPLPGEAAVELVSDDSGEQGNLVAKHVTPCVCRIKISHRNGVKKGHLLPVLQRCVEVVKSEVMNAYEMAGRPPIEDGQPFGLSLLMQPAFLVGTLADMKGDPTCNSEAVFQVFKQGDTVDDKGTPTWDRLKDAEGNPVFNTPEETINLAIEGTFEQLCEFAAQIEAEWDERSYKGWLHASWLWDKKPTPTEVN